MKAVHTFWSLPDGFDKAETYSLLTGVLSALMWQRYNGEITLVTDTPGKERIYSLGLENAWNSITTELDKIPKAVDPQVFWAAGKLYGIRNIKTPFVSMDMDFIVWEPLELEKISSNLCVIHKEALTGSVYPDTLPYTSFDEGFSWQVLPCNTAFFYANSSEFIDGYTSYADRFMKTCKEKDCLRPMVFAEQRLFSMVAEKMNVHIDTFSSLEKLMDGNDTRFTHLWGYKSQLRNNPQEKAEFTEKLRSRIIKEFPDFKRKIEQIQ